MLLTVLLVCILSVQIGHVGSRALRMPAANSGEGGGMIAFAVSSENSSSISVGSVISNFGAVLASGPSRRGAGH